MLYLGLGCVFLHIILFYTKIIYLISYIINLHNFSIYLISLLINFCSLLKKKCINKQLRNREWRNKWSIVIHICQLKKKNSLLVSLPSQIYKLATRTASMHKILQASGAVVMNTILPSNILHFIFYLYFFIMVLDSFNVFIWILI